nr:guanylate-binding protein 1-like [Pelodiscus sinensis]|eukprot:XP_025044995.1 guanylate-binding protein 1-like [Pelodiscus sinensis]
MLGVTGPQDTKPSAGRALGPPRQTPPAQPQPPLSQIRPLRAQGDTKNDTWIFSLAVLLSSTLVYNSKGTIDQYALEQLHFVSELTDHIKVKAQAGDEGEDTEFVRFFPGFVWAVRDFTLALEIDGQQVTEDQYLEHALALKKGELGCGGTSGFPHLLHLQLCNPAVPRASQGCQVSTPTRSRG